MGKLTKEVLGLAGEYAVASELCRRGLYSQLTLGNHKRTDILVETDARMLRISVKAKQGSEWPSISGPTRTDDFIIFVDFAGKGEDERLDFYVLGQADWRAVLDQALAAQKSKGIEPTMRDGMIIWPDGWRGINVGIKSLEKYRENWSAILSTIVPAETIA
jgi:hypothetical protein